MTKTHNKQQNPCKNNTSLVATMRVQKDMRTETIKIRVTKEEKAAFNDSAKKEGLTLSSFFRWLHANHKPKGN